ncbi:hexokinase [Mariniphaga sediminis]|uniref:Hexokinase n=1 Tax=Mariniphaga sediminis TaxID=1628158 RepID=A0A399CXJ1_9BACT|nr:hexokinase [Mariniphaga sediminis]RIH64139.1 hexokinase [Mariniphaga sediminis]
MSKAKQFLKDHKLTASEIDIQKLTDLFIRDMDAGLQNKESSLMMIPTYIETGKELKPNLPVIAVDAGGTNFRTAKVYFDEKMQLVTENLKNTSMPAVDKELSKEEFFEKMAEFLEEYKAESEKIGFCFSYAVEMFPNKDGKLVEWSKEVKAPEVIGEMIGKKTLEAMGTPEKEVVLLNDTVATLLAGQAATAAKSYDTYIGFILGTGTNTSYIESNKNITKTPNLDLEKNQIINIESGNFDKVPRTDIDVLFDNQTKNPGRYSFEKMFSGGYFGGLCTTALKVAANENVFSEASKNNIIALAELTSEEVNKFVCGINPDENILGKSLVSEEDKTAAAEIIEGMIERSAKLVAGNLAAVILKTDKAKTAEKPVLLTIEGTTFYKLKNFQKMFEGFLQEFLSGKNERHYEIVEVANSSLLGAAIAGIVN